MGQCRSPVIRQLCLPCSLLIANWGLGAWPTRIPSPDLQGPTFMNHLTTHDLCSLLKLSSSPKAPPMKPWTVTKCPPGRPHPAGQGAWSGWSCALTWEAQGGVARRGQLLRDVRDLL